MTTTRAQPDRNPTTRDLPRCVSSYYMLVVAFWSPSRPAPVSVSSNASVPGVSRTGPLCDALARALPKSKVSAVFAKAFSDQREKSSLGSGFQDEFAKLLISGQDKETSAGKRTWLKRFASYSWYHVFPDIKRICIEV